MKIYLIDDDPIYRFTFEVSLRKLEGVFALSTFEDGEKAIEQIKVDIDSELPAVIFLDINMPIMDGWDFMESIIQLKESMDKFPKIYMVSSSIDERDISKAKSYKEIVDYLIKPITIVTINNILNGTE